MATKSRIAPGSNIIMNKTFLQWFGVIVTLATLLVAIGAFKTKMINVEESFNTHCTEQKQRETKINDVLNSIAVSSERLTVHIEVLTKSVDELKTEIKKNRQ